MRDRSFSVGSSLPKNYEVNILAVENPEICVFYRYFQQSTAHIFQISLCPHIHPKLPSSRAIWVHRAAALSASSRKTIPVSGSAERAKYSVWARQVLRKHWFRSRAVPSSGVAAIRLRRTAPASGVKAAGRNTGAGRRYFRAQNDAPRATLSTRLHDRAGRKCSAVRLFHKDAPWI